MHVSEQGIQPSSHRYQVVPRTLIFITSTDPRTARQEVLLLKGAAHKRLWANKYNGFGGHLEAGEDVMGAALRELHEETGLVVSSLQLRALLTIHTAQAAGVLVLVFLGESIRRQLRPSDEGTPEWIPVADLDRYPLVDDLVDLLPRILAGGPLVYGNYSPLPDGTLHFNFREG